MEKPGGISCFLKNLGHFFLEHKERALIKTGPIVKKEFVQRNRTGEF